MEYLISDDPPPGAGRKHPYWKAWWIERHGEEGSRDLGLAALSDALDVQRVSKCVHCGGLIEPSLKSATCSENCRKRMWENSAARFKTSRQQEYKRRKERYQALRAAGVPVSEAKSLSSSGPATEARLKEAA